MLKTPIPVKESEAKAAQSLSAILKQVPAIKVKSIARQPSATAGSGLDMMASVTVSGKQHMLVCEFKASGQPRHVRAALLQLRSYAAHYTAQRGRRPVTAVLIAPFLSPEAQELCRKEGVGYLDFEGNARLVFDSVFIERTVASKPAVERRELRSLFKPKSAQVLMALLRDPARPWRVTQLANAAGVSLGHVSNVRAALLEREWGRVSDQGLFLSAPTALLDAWRNAYRPPTGTRAAFYSALHGRALEDAARQVLGVGSEKGQVMFASFSAAQWLAPFTRTGTHFFYADERGLNQLKAALTLSSPSKGENVIVIVPRDEDIFRNAVEPSPGMTCTDAVQTYLDLTAAGERGREAAEHLRLEKLTWDE